MTGNNKDGTYTDFAKAIVKQVMKEHLSSETTHVTVGLTKTMMLEVASEVERAMC